MPDGFVFAVGSVLAGRYPLGVDGRDPDLLNRLVARGVATFIDLTEQGELRSYARRLPPDVQHIRVPVIDGDAPTDDQAQIVRRVVARRRVEGLVYIHCRAGCGRTAATLAAAQLLGREGSSDMYLRLAQLARAVDAVRCPETRAQQLLVSAVAHRR